jgi:hypothetical protein
MPTWKINNMDQEEREQLQQHYYYLWLEAGALYHKMGEHPHNSLPYIQAWVAYRERLVEYGEKTHSSNLPLFREELAKAQQELSRKMRERMITPYELRRYAREYHFDEKLGFSGPEYKVSWFVLNHLHFDQQVPQTYNALKWYLRSEKDFDTRVIIHRYLHYIARGW